MRHNIERSHWLNTIVGLLDAAFYLSDEEQFLVLDLVNRLLVSLNIPERSTPTELPAALSLEVSTGFYTSALNSSRDSGMNRPVRAANADDVVVSIESWCQAILGMVLSAYPDLDPYERVISTKVLGEMLMALGVPTRAAAFFPDEVMRAYRTSPDAPWLMT